MPSSLKLAEAFGDDLAILFVEAQGASKKKAEQFAWNQGWMATTAMWGNEQPLVLDTDKLPVCALLSSEGGVLLMGNPISLHKDIEDAIRLEIKRATKVSKDVPRSLHGAWKSFQKGDYEKAFQAAIEVELPGDDDAPAAVAERLEDLADSAEGVVEIESLLAPIQERLASDEMEPEFDAAKAFAKIETRLKKDGLEDKWLRQLEPFMKKHEGTLAAERADQLLRLSKIK